MNGTTKVMPMLEGNDVTWEEVVVAVEIAVALTASLWMLRRKARCDTVILGGVDHTPIELSPLTQPRSRCPLTWLLAFRVTVAACYLFLQCFEIHRTQWKCLAFYTSWNFIAQGVYFTSAAARTFAIWKDQEVALQQPYALVKDDSELFQRARGRGLRSAHRGWVRLDLLLDGCLAVSLLITAVVWSILLPYARRIGHPEKILNWVSYCQHALNTVLLQVDFMATRHSVSQHTLPLVIAWCSTYAIFAWVVHGTVKHGFWPYPFLKLDTPWAPLWYAGLLFAHIFAFVVVICISKLKHSVCRTSSPAHSSEQESHAMNVKQAFLSPERDADTSDSEEHSPFLASTSSPAQADEPSPYHRF